MTKESKQKATQGFLKLKNYLEEILKSDKFQQKIQELRKKYSIQYGKPRNISRDLDRLYPIPLKKNKKSKKRKDKYSNLIEEIKQFQQEFNLYGAPWHEIIWDYLFYNNAFLNEHFSYYSYDLCRIDDLLEEEKDREKENKNPNQNYRNFWKKLREDYRMQYPIAIEISPYATERDILDFIKKNYTYNIKPIQKDHKKDNVKIGKVRQKNIQTQKRNEFIWKHRNSSRKKITYLVNEKFKGQALGYADVEKIIVLENKKRKEL